MIQVNEKDQWNGTFYGYEQWNGYAYEPGNGYGYKQGNGSGYGDGTPGYEYYQVMLSEVGMWIMLFMSVFALGYLFWSYIPNMKLKPALFRTLNFKNLKFGLRIMIIATLIFGCNGMEINQKTEISLLQNKANQESKLNKLSKLFKLNKLSKLFKLPEKFSINYLILTNVMHAILYISIAVDPQSMVFGEYKGEGENASLYVKNLFYGLIPTFSVLMFILYFVFSVKYNIYDGYLHTQSIIYKTMAECFLLFAGFDAFTLMIMGMIGISNRTLNSAKSFVDDYVRILMPTCFGFWVLIRLSYKIGRTIIGIKWPLWSLKGLKGFIRAFSVSLLTLYWALIMINYDRFMDRYWDYDETFGETISSYNKYLHPFNGFFEVSLAFNILDVFLSLYSLKYTSFGLFNRSGTENKSTEILYYDLRLISFVMLFEILLSLIGSLLGPFFSSIFIIFSTIYQVFSMSKSHENFFEKNKSLHNFFFLTVVVVTCFEWFSFGFDFKAFVSNLSFFIISNSLVNMMSLFVMFAFFIRYF